MEGTLDGDASVVKKPLKGGHSAGKGSTSDITLFMTRLRVAHAQCVQ